LAVADGWLVIDISDPSHPSLVASYPYPFGQSALNIAAAGNLAFVCQDSLSIWDISDPANAFMRAYCETPGGCEAVEVFGQFAFVAARQEGIHIIDCSDPDAPFIASTFRTGGCAYNLAIRNDTIYVANGTSLQILHIVDSQAIDESESLPNGITLQQNYPNPFNARTTISFSLPKDFAGVMSIYDITGRLVRKIDIKSGSDRVMWDGKNGAGQPVSSGVYFYAMEGHPETARKMILLK
jgi:hypothetical protein